MEEPFINDISIYVAGKWADKEYIHQQIQLFESYGFTITHNWTQVEQEEISTDDERAGFAAADINGVVAADYAIFLITDEKYPYRGSCSELGAALATETPVIVVDPFENSGFRTNIFSKHYLVTRVRTVEEALDTFAKECITCGDITRSTKLCQCRKFICKECLKSGTYDINDWLTIDNKCSICDILVCPNCANVCSDCANEDRDFTVYCSDCVSDDFVYDECKYHQWGHCKDHAARKCGECAANKNYSDRHAL